MNILPLCAPFPGMDEEWTSEMLEGLATALEGYETEEVKKAPWKPLTDVQWMNIVNHEQAYWNYTKEDAVNLAVKLTEAKLKENYEKA